MGFFDMGGYAAFVWPSYAVAAIVMVGLFVAVRIGLRRDERLLAQLQTATGNRRARRRGPGSEGVSDTGTERDAARTGTGDGPEDTGTGDALDDGTPPEDGERA